MDVISIDKVLILFFGLFANNLHDNLLVYKRKPFHDIICSISLF